MSNERNTISDLQQNPKIQVVIEYDTVTQGCAWRVGNGFPIANLIYTIDLLKTVLLQSELQNMAKEKERRIAIAPATVLPFREN